MTRDELIALAKAFLDELGPTLGQEERAPELAHAFLEADAERESLTFVLKETQAEAARLQRIEAERDAAQAEVEALKKEGRAALKQKVACLESEVDRLVGDRRDWLKDSQDGWRACSLVTAERDRLQAELSALRAEIEALKKRVSTGLLVIESMQAEIEAAKVVYRNENRRGGWGWVWGIAVGDPTHRARLVRIEKIGE